MGHKVNPVCLRIGIHKGWNSRWFAPHKRTFVEYLQEDVIIRQLLKKELASAAVSRIEIERSPDRLHIKIHTARPGVLIGRRGEHIQRLEEAVRRIIGPERHLKMDPIEVTNPYVEAQLIAESIAFQLEKRVAYRRAMKRAIQQAMESGAKGVKILCAGRLGGSEMKRREVYRAGKVPLGTLRSDIEFGQAVSHTTAGCIGTKVWTYHGDKIRLKPSDEAITAEPAKAGQLASPVAEPAGG